MRIQHGNQLLIARTHLGIGGDDDARQRPALFKRQGGEITVLVQIALAQLDGIAQGARVAQVGCRQKRSRIIQMTERAYQQPWVLLLLGQLLYQLPDCYQRNPLSGRHAAQLMAY